MRAQNALFKRFIKKHEKWLTFAGAFIIFMTFVIKEGLGEHWRRTSEAVDTARYFFLLENQVFDTEDHLRTKLIEVRDLVGKDRPVSSFLRAERDYIFLLLARADRSLDAMGILLEQLPNTKEKKQKADELRQEVFDLNQKLEEYQSKDETEDALVGSKHETLTGDSLSRYELKHKEEKDFFTILYTVCDTSRDFTNNVIQIAENVRTVNAKRADHARWISAVLFTLGWGLGLLGKIYGVPESASGE